MGDRKRIWKGERERDFGERADGKGLEGLGKRKISKVNMRSFHMAVWVLRSIRGRAGELKVGLG